MKKLLLFSALLVVGVLLFLKAMEGVEMQEVSEVVRTFWGSKGLLLVVLTAAVLCIGAFRWKEILRHQGYHFSFLFLLRLYLGGFALSFFAPMIFFGSEVFRSYSLEASYGIPFSKSLPASIIERLLEGTVYLFFVAAGFLVLFFTHTELSQALWGVVLATLLLAVLFFYFYFKSARRESLIRLFFPSLKRTNGILEIEQEVLRFFHLGNSAFWEGLALSFVKGVGTLLRTMVLGLFLGKFLGVFASLTVTGFVFLSLFLPIPGQLGSHEALQSIAFQALNMDTASGVAFALVIRAAELLVALAGVLFLVRFGFLIAQNVMLQKIGKMFS